MIRFFVLDDLIVNDGDISGVIDFDMASPGSRIWDISYLAYRLVLFAEDSFTYDDEAFGSTSVRLQALLQAYGIDFDRRELQPTRLMTLIMGR